MLLATHARTHAHTHAQKAFKDGLDKFKLYIYKYFTYQGKIISHHKYLTELETCYISKLNLDTFRILVLLLSII